MQLKWNHFPVGKQWWSQIESFISDGPIEPGFALIYCSNNCNFLEEEEAENEAKYCHLRDLLVSALPPKCGFQVVAATDIIGTDDQMKTKGLGKPSLSLMMFSKFMMEHPFFDLDFLPFSLEWIEDKSSFGNPWEGSFLLDDRTFRVSVFKRDMVHKQKQQTCQHHAFCVIYYANMEKITPYAQHQENYAEWG
ncbi:hypothetical protein PoB_005546000 [Plakobranchus ocellatus]|uniref:Uncharacterized protein n=1 Tax=Plakobranchus ocellatus TaxID=259542 RepID=A0AAV4CBC5_9GAST|nr:hypothetical protein PoB_005546000 [Plakobranchus ocellatus]